MEYHIKYGTADILSSQSELSFKLLSYNLYTFFSFIYNNILLYIFFYYNIIYIIYINLI